MQKQFGTTLKRAAVLVGLLGMAAATEAAPVTYNFASGSATLSLTYAGGSLLAPGSTVALTGTQATFDAAALQLTSFQFTDAGPSNATGAGALTGTIITVSNLNIIPGVGYSTLSMTGSNPYTYLVGPIAVSGIYSLSGAINQGPTAFSSVNPLLSGGITLGGVTNLSLNGITLGAFTLPPILGGGVATLKADVIFNGVVPVPAAVWLFGSGLGLMGLLRRRAA